MKNLLRYFVVLILGAFILQNVHAIEASKVPMAKRSLSEKYFTSKEASKYLARHEKSTLFIDVRDPTELFTVGMPTLADVNIPFKRININKWDMKKSTFKLDNNPNFINDVAARLKTKGLSQSNTIIVMCGSGKRSAKAASALTKAGYKNVYTIIDGYKGWQKSHLKWSKKLDKSKMYITLN